MGELGQDAEVTPPLFPKDFLEFLMTTESQDLGLTSHPKDGAFLQYSVPVNIQGRLDPHRLQGEHPLLASLTFSNSNLVFPRRSPIEVLTRLNPA